MAPGFLTLPRRIASEPGREAPAARGPAVRQAGQSPDVGDQPRECASPKRFARNDSIGQVVEPVMT